MPRSDDPFSRLHEDSEIRMESRERLKSRIEDEYERTVGSKLVLEAGEYRPPRHLSISTQTCDIETINALNDGILNRRPRATSPHHSTRPCTYVRARSLSPSILRGIPSPTSPSSSSASPIKFSSAQSPNSPTWLSRQRQRQSSFSPSISRELPQSNSSMTLNVFGRLYEENWTRKYHLSQLRERIEGERIYEIASTQFRNKHARSASPHNNRSSDSHKDWGNSLYEDRVRYRLHREFMARKIEKERRDSIAMTSFKESIGHLRSSPSLRPSPSQKIEDGSSIGEKLYIYGLSWQGKRERRLLEEREASLKKKEEEEMLECSFAPDLGATQQVHEQMRVSRPPPDKIFENQYDQREVMKRSFQKLVNRIEDDLKLEYPHTPTMVSKRSEKLSEKRRMERISRTLSRSQTLSGNNCPSSHRMSRSASSSPRRSGSSGNVSPRPYLARSYSSRFLDDNQLSPTSPNPNHRHDGGKNKPNEANLSASSSSSSPKSTSRLQPASHAQNDPPPSTTDKVPRVPSFEINMCDLALDHDGVAITDNAMQSSGGSGMTPCVELVDGVNNTTVPVFDFHSHPASPFDSLTPIQVKESSGDHVIESPQAATSVSELFNSDFKPIKENQPSPNVAPTSDSNMGEANRPDDQAIPESEVELEAELEAEAGKNDTCEESGQRPESQSPSLQPAIESQSPTLELQSPMSMGKNTLSTSVSLFDQLYDERYRQEELRSQLLEKYAYREPHTPTRLAASFKSSEVQEDEDKEAFFKRLHCHSYLQSYLAEIAKQRAAAEIRNQDVSKSVGVMQGSQVSDMITRLTRDDIAMRAQNRETRKAVIKEAIDRPHTVRHTNSKSEELATAARRRNLVQIFDVLCLSVEYNRSLESGKVRDDDNRGGMVNLGEQSAFKSKSILNSTSKTPSSKNVPNEPDDTPMQETSSSSARTPYFAHSTQSPRSSYQPNANITATAMRAQKLFSPQLPKSIEKSMHDGKPGLQADPVLYTKLALPQLLQPKALADALVAILARAPATLTAEEFIHVVEIAVQSRQCPQLSSLLSSRMPKPLGPSSEERAATQVTGKPFRIASKMSEKYVQAKLKPSSTFLTSLDHSHYEKSDDGTSRSSGKYRNSNIADYLYSQRVELEEKNKQRLREYEREMQRECTFKPVIHSKDTYRIAQLKKKKKMQEDAKQANQENEVGCSVIVENENEKCNE